MTKTAVIFAPFAEEYSFDKELKWEKRVVILPITRTFGLYAKRDILNSAAKKFEEKGFDVKVQKSGLCSDIGALKIFLSRPY